MAEKVAELGLERDPDYMYFVKAGDVWRLPRDRQDDDWVPERVAECGVAVDGDYVYFLDRNGDVSRCKRPSENRGRPKKGQSRSKVLRSSQANKTSKRQAPPAEVPGSDGDGSVAPEAAVQNGATHTDMADAEVASDQAPARKRSRSKAKTRKATRTKGD